MKKVSKLALVVLCVTLIFSMAGCGQAPKAVSSAGSAAPSASTASSAGTGTDTKPIRITYITSGQRGDNGAADSSWPMIQKLNQQYPGKVKAQMLEMAQDTSKFESAILETLDAGCDILICGSGYSMADTANKYAAEYPDTTFYFIDLNLDYKFSSPKNTVGMSYKQNEGMFLTGALAASLSKTGKIGFIGGMENAIINDFGTGYIAGATHVNPKIKIQFSYVGNFNDSAKGKELAGIQAHLGADVIHNVAGTAGLGVLEGAFEAGVTPIGVDNDQSAGFKETNPKLANAIVTSMIKNWGQVIYNFSVRYIENRDSIKYGEIERLGLESGAVALAKNDVYKSRVPADVQQSIDKLEKDVIAGNIKVPSAFDRTDEEWKQLKESVAF